MDRFQTVRQVVCLLMLSCLAAMVAQPALAAEVENRWGASAELGHWKLVEGSWDHSNVDNFAGLGLRRGLSSNWVATLGYRYGIVRPGVNVQPYDLQPEAGWTHGSFTNLFTQIHNTTLDFTYLMTPNKTISPFVGLGLGLTAWRVLWTDDDPGFFASGTTVQGYGDDSESGDWEELASMEFTLTTEVGAEWWASETFSVRAGARYHLMPGNDLDNVGLSSWNMEQDPAYVDANNGLVQGFLGVTYWFGGPGDKDHDGIEDRFDTCPQVAEDLDGFEDHDGCPDYDNDRDGIPDEDDQCPNDPEDLDGFEDSDGCPDPDNDGDGVLDANDGCPDRAEDFDGFEDSDGCPDPDNDGDGVLDALDRCSDTTPGVRVDEFGCEVAPPPPSDPAIQAIEGGLVLEGVTFRSGSAQILPSSLNVLQRVARSLKDNSHVRVEVRGHTDSAGAAEANRQLSHRRAMAVRDFLIQLGIQPSRITAVGYGEDYPVASNDTPGGRATNRRVELHRIN